MQRVRRDRLRRQRRGAGAPALGSHCGLSTTSSPTRRRSPTSSTTRRTTRRTPSRSGTRSSPAPRRNASVTVARYSRCLAGPVTFSAVQTASPWRREHTAEDLDAVGAAPARRGRPDRRRPRRRASPWSRRSRSRSRAVRRCCASAARRDPTPSRSGARPRSRTRRATPTARRRRPRSRASCSGWRGRSITAPA